ncbi:MAG: hypothetical protein IJP92_06635 [Lachnospiraceae bacterium]|nr:hypothetical protein [Lachnospiraceae bacterium]
MELANELELFKRDIGVIAEINTRITGYYKRLFTEILELNTMWEGPAHSAYEQSFINDSLIVEDALRFLELFYRDMEMVSRESAKCEAGVADVIAAIKI